MVRCWGKDSDRRLVALWGRVLLVRARMALALSAEREGCREPWARCNSKLEQRRPGRRQPGDRMPLLIPTTSPLQTRKAIQIPTPARAEAAALIRARQLGLV